MNNIVVIGLQWGDEGKGKIIDYLSKWAEIVIRFQGGSNAGHTLCINGKYYKLSCLPSNIMRNNKISIISSGNVIDLSKISLELNIVKSKNLVLIAENSTLILSLHKELDKLFDSKINFIGTTNEGVGPAYIDKIARRAIKLIDLKNLRLTSTKVDKLLFYHNLVRKYFKYNYIKKKKIILELLSYKRISNLHHSLIHFYLNKNEFKKILFEGAQGILLDNDYGTYPYVTSSNTMAMYSSVSCGYNKKIYVLGIIKSYTTRVGNGPFPTEISDKNGTLLQLFGNEFGTVSNRKRRCGWIDIISIRHSIIINNVNGLVVTKIDVLDNLKYIKICVGYILKQKKINYLPMSNFEQINCIPIYITLNGWLSSTKNINRYLNFPINARKYISLLQKLIGIPIILISNGPEREKTIII